MKGVIMPCNSDYLNQSKIEEELQKTAKLLVALNKKLKIPSPDWVVKASEEYYCHEHKVVPELCATIRKLSKEQKDKFIYNGRDPEARKLADWFDEHDKADKERIKQEKASKKANDQRIKEYKAKHNIT